jgi:uncharacterized protein YacL
MNPSLLYTRKVWFTIILLAPTFGILSILFRAKNMDDVMDVFKLFIGIPMAALLFGIITIPSVIAFYFATKYLFTSYFNQFSVKIVLSILGILLTFLSAGLMDEFKLKFNIDYLLTIAPYLFAVVISVWIYKFRPANLH